MSNPKWCTKHSQYAHDCSDCGVTEGKLSSIRARAGRIAAKNRNGIKRPGQAVGLSRQEKFDAPKVAK